MDDKNKIFIEKAKIKHGDKYDYSKIDYKNNTTPICIICHEKDKFGREHGEFWQLPKDHLRGNKCPKCSRTIFNTNDFVLYASDKHNEKYNYSKTIYINAHTPIIITCPIHGDFKMRPHNHLKGQGCPLCANKEKGAYKKNNTENFIERATKKHNGKYDYSKVEYINNYTKVCIICPEHGEFWQKPNDHLRGIGCFQCGRKYNLAEKEVLEALQTKYKNVIYQYKPSFLHGKTSAQSIDFFLPDYNIGIEYHGRQHFIPIPKFGGDDGFEKTKERDYRKHQKCQENGLTIYYLTFEKCDTSNYFSKVYTNLDELYSKIEQDKNTLPLNQDDINEMVCKIIKEIKNKKI